MQHVRDTAGPLVGGNYSGIYVHGLGYQAPVVHQPEWRQQEDGMAVGWMDPQTAPLCPPTIPVGK